MKRQLMVVGAVVLNAILFSFPVLTALSFIFGWPGFIKWVLAIVTGCEFIASTYILYGMCAE